MGLLYGPTCLAKCPVGTKENGTTCEGCRQGCEECDPTNPAICTKCGKDLLRLDGNCLEKCPAGYMSKFWENECISLASVDMKLMYFPFLVVALILLAFSVTAQRIKVKHRTLTNFILMMGCLEFFSTLAQLIFTFKFGRPVFAAVIVVIFVIYIALNIVFFVLFIKRIKQKDEKFTAHHAKKSEHRPEAIATEVLAVVFSWRFIKLFYSHFLGTRVKVAEFSNPWGFEALQKKAMYAAFGFYYLPLFVLCLVGLMQLNWGTQLYVCLVENLVFSVVMPVLLFIEQRRMRDYMQADTYFRLNRDTGLKFMCGLQESYPEKDKMLNKLNTQPEFLNYKLEELLAKFGERMCRSCVEFGNELEKAEPRACRSLVYEDQDLPDNFKIDDPPRPLKYDPYPDNVRAVGLDPSHFKMFVPPYANCTNKGCQAGGEFAGDLTRTDAAMLSSNVEPLVRVFDDEDFEHSKNTGYSSKRGEKKKRGRRNRFLSAIDNEDVDAGILLDTDSEGDANTDLATKMGAAQAAKLDTIREEEE